MMDTQTASVIEKLNELSPEFVAEVEDFIDFLILQHRDRALTHAAMSFSERSLERVWNNPEDADYDNL